jgi:hypothetical protein
MPTLKVKDADEDDIYLHAETGDGSEGSPLVQSKWVRNLGALAATLASDLIGTDVARTQVAAVQQLWDAAAAAGAGAYIRARGSVAFGLLADVSRIVGALPAGNNTIGNVGVVTLPALAAGTNIIGSFRAASVKDPAWVTGLSSLGDFIWELPANVFDGMNEAQVDLYLGNTGAPSGVIHCEKSVDNVHWKPLIPHPDTVDGQVAGQVVLGTTTGTKHQITITAPAAPVVLGLNFDSPAPYTRFRYVRGGGGALAQGSGAYFGRST